VSIGLIITVLLQSGKGGGLAGAFGGGEVETVFGSRGIASRLTKMTTGLAVAFMLLCIILAFISSPRQAGKSAIQERLDAGQPQSTAPAATPAPQTAPQQPQPRPVTQPESEEDAGN